MKSLGNTEERIRIINDVTESHDRQTTAKLLPCRKSVIWVECESGKKRPNQQAKGRNYELRRRQRRWKGRKRWQLFPLVFQSWPARGFKARRGTSPAVSKWWKAVKNARSPAESAGFSRENPWKFISSTKRSRLKSSSRSSEWVRHEKIFINLLGAGRALVIYSFVRGILLRFFLLLWLKTSILRLAARGYWSD